MKKLKLTILFLALLLLAKSVFGITNSEIELCFSNSKLDVYCNREGDDACQAILNKCDDYLTEVQKEYEQDIKRTEEEKQNLANQIYRLENRMTQLEQQIQQSEMRIRNLGFEIGDTQESIKKMNSEIENSRDELAEMIKTVNREDQKTVLEILITENDLSGFFNNLTALETLTKESKSILEEIKDLRNSLETKEQRLAREREEAQRQAELQALQKAESEAAKEEQEYLYNLTQEEYEQQMQQKEFIDERAEEILSRKLSLVGLPESETPSFEEALEVAKWAQNLTGIRPAFLLAIITQESALGRNVGECYLTDVNTGEGIRIRSGAYVSNLMATPPRSSRNDAQKFLQITKQLGLDPYETPVSCPLSYGWGGAMGPAQFIPTTWWSQKEDIKQNLGEEPNPWKLRDSFLASATYLHNLGGVYNERAAALKYYAGGNWNHPKNSFYGDQVVRRINCLQTFIDEKTMSPACSKLVFIPK